MMSFGQTRTIALLVIIVTLFLPFAVAAGIPTIVPDECNEIGGCQSICDIAQLAQNVLNAGIYIAIILSAFMFAWAGWRAMTSGGNTEQYAQAKKIFGNVLIGLIIILVGWIVIDTLMRTFVGVNPGLPWNKICP